MLVIGQHLSGGKGSSPASLEDMTTPWGQTPTRIQSGAIVSVPQPQSTCHGWQLGTFLLPSRTPFLWHTETSASFVATNLSSLAIVAREEEITSIHQARPLIHSKPLSKYRVLSARIMCSVFALVAGLVAVPKIHHLGPIFGRQVLPSIYPALGHQGCTARPTAEGYVWPRGELGRRPRGIVLAVAPHCWCQ